MLSSRLPQCVSNSVYRPEFPNEILCTHHVYAVHATCHTRLIFLDVKHMKEGKRYKFFGEILLEGCQ